MSEALKLLAISELHSPSPEPQHNVRSMHCELHPAYMVKWMEPCPACEGQKRRCLEDHQEWPCRTAQVLTAQERVYST